jgi:hypothetical protein
MADLLQAGDPGIGDRGVDNLIRHERLEQKIDVLIGHLHRLAIRAQGCFEL